MIEILLAITLLPLLMLGWVLVQAAWRRRVGSAANDDDALAARGGCGSCDCVQACGQKND